MSLSRFPSTHMRREERQRLRKMPLSVLVLLVGAALGALSGSAVAATPTSPPPVTILSAQGNIGQGDIFVTPTGDSGTYANGPEILDGTNNLVWFHAIPQGQTRCRFQNPEL